VGDVIAVASLQSHGRNVTHAVDRQPVMEFNLPDSGATDALGQALARALPITVYLRAAGAGGAVGCTTGAAGSGAVMYLQGELGAGKTTCARSLLRALGVTGLVRSPTYTLVETYILAALTCVHVDLYRLQGYGEVDELGLRDLVGPGCLLMVEWPEKGGGALPPADLDLTFNHSGDSRQGRLAAKTPLGIEWLSNLVRDSSLSSYVSNLT
jgi:tRNA threonylcarbamoyladenosine biosynthesis protein TsaE